MILLFTDFEKMYKELKLRIKFLLTAIGDCYYKIVAYFPFFISCLNMNEDIMICKVKDVLNSSF